MFRRRIKAPPGAGRFEQQCTCQTVPCCVKGKNQLEPTMQAKHAFSLGRADESSSARPTKTAQTLIFAWQGQRITGQRKQNELRSEDSPSSPNESSSARQTNLAQTSIFAWQGRRTARQGERVHFRCFQSHSTQGGVFARGMGEGSSEVEGCGGKRGQVM
jgi:hypothetical protein